MSASASASMSAGGNCLSVNVASKLTPFGAYLSSFAFGISTPTVNNSPRRRAKDRDTGAEAVPRGMCEQSQVRGCCCS